ncbi:MAG: hypothetical protein A2X18_05715 [Bacteroidetes bacterium GWF2_40_14]|nr:MAG: hypothetical protein A2X18_05715 [Bacteroidetes bacterium GWF2_40_14]
MKRSRLVIIILLFSNLLFAKEPVNDFEVKGFHIDLRCQIMTMPALKAFAKELSEFGINTIVMEWEATFPFMKHATLCNKYSYSAEEVASFIKYCGTIGIDVIPLQNCFGHVEYILSHDRYSYLKEDKKEVSQLCPMKEEECVELFTEIFKEVAAMHPSKYFHIGGDETYLLGSCKLCAEKSAKVGKSKLFVDYVKAMCKIATDLGKTPVLWADVILKYPDAVGELPKEAIFIDWNYGWKNDHFGDIGRLYKAGVTFWGSPSIRSHPDNLYLTQWNKHFNNQQIFIPYARKNNYKGVVMTSWSNGGTYGFLYDTGWEVVQMYPIRYVYPLSGFRIIVACYGEALKTNGPVDAEAFVIKYSQERFGFSQEEGKLLWDILTAPQEEVVKGKDLNKKSVSEILKETKYLRSELYRLRPKTNTKEFEHFKLMFDIRVQYLLFKEAEWEYESRNFKREVASAYIDKLSLLVDEAKKIDKRFINLNRGFLYDKELVEINKLRTEKLFKMYNTLQNLIK